MYAHESKCQAMFLNVASGVGMTAYMSLNNKELGYRLAAARQLRGLTTRQAMGDVIGRDRATISEWEKATSHRRPSEEMLMKIAVKLKLPDWFFEDANAFNRTARQPTTGQELREIVRSLDDLNARVDDLRDRLPERRPEDELPATPPVRRADAASDDGGVAREVEAAADELADAPRPASDADEASPGG